MTRNVPLISAMATSLRLSQTGTLASSWFCSLVISVQEASIRARWRLRSTRFAASSTGVCEKGALQVSNLESQDCSVSTQLQRGEARGPPSDLPTSQAALSGIVQ